MNYVTGQTSQHFITCSTVPQVPTPFVVSYNQIHLFNTVLLDSKQLGLTKFMNASLHVHLYL